MNDFLCLNSLNIFMLIIYVSKMLINQSLSAKHLNLAQLLAIIITAYFETKHFCAKEVYY